MDLLRTNAVRAFAPENLLGDFALLDGRAGFVFPARLDGRLLLFLVPERPREVWTLWALSWLSGVVAGILFARSVAPDLDGRQMAFRAPIVALMYLPCLAMVLRRPNVA